MAEGLQLLKAADAAEVLGVDESTVKRWIVQRGCPCVTRRPYVVEIGAVRKWMAENMDESGAFAGGHGRGGDHAKKAAAAEAVVAFVGDDDDEPVVVPTTGDELMQLVREQGVTASQIKLWDAACDLADKLDEAKVKRGRLIDAADAKMLMRQWCVDIRERVLQAPARIAARGGELGLGQKDQVRLKDMAEQVIADVLVSLRAEARDRPE